MNFEVIKKERYVQVNSKIEKLDSHVAPELKSLLVLLNGEGHSNMILNLAESRYCDSSGLSAVLVANRLCNNCNGSFVLTGLQDNVAKLVSISQLDSVLNITPTVDEAIDLLFMEEIERELGDEDENN
jgi:anti-sigma B factor antagonist